MSGRKKEILVVAISFIILTTGLTLSCGDGCSCTTSYYNLVAIASADVTTGYAPLTVIFAGRVSGENPPFTYGWDFGDGGTSTKKNPTHTYNTLGTFTAVFTVTDATGDSDSDSIEITVGQLTVELTAAQESISVGDTVTITARVTLNGIAQADKEVSFEITSKPTGSSASLYPVTEITDIGGEAATLLSAGEETGEIVVEAEVDGVSGPATVMVCEVCVESIYGETAFRMSMMAVDENTTGNQLGEMAVPINLTTADLIDSGMLNVLTVIIGAPANITGTYDVVAVMISGACEDPESVESPTCGGEVKDEFYIDPASYDEGGCIKLVFDATLINGHFYSEIPEMTFDMTAEGIYIPFPMADLVLEGDVNVTMTVFSGTMSGILVERDLVSGMNAAFVIMVGPDDIPSNDCTTMRAAFGTPEADLGAPGVPDCDMTPLIKWCWCEKGMQVLCASEMPLPADCVALCNSQGGTQDCKETVGDYAPDDPMYKGSEDGYTERVLFEADKVDLLRPGE